MNVQHAPTAVIENREVHSAARVPRRWLALARAVWMVLALLLLANFSASIPATYGQLRTICTSSAFGHCNIWQPTPANMQALQHLGLSLETYAAYTLTMDVLASLVFLAVGALIFWRKSDEWVGLFVSLVLVIFGSFGIADSLAGTFITAQTPGAVKLLFLGRCYSSQQTSSWCWEVRQASRSIAICASTLPCSVSRPSGWSMP